MARHAQKQAQGPASDEGPSHALPSTRNSSTSIWERSLLLVVAPRFATFVPTPGFLNNFFMIALQEEKIKSNLNSP